MPFSIHTIFRHVSPLFRKGRMKRFVSSLQPTSSTTILDVGGYPGTWRGFSCRPHLTILNVHPIEYVAAPGDPPIQTVLGDGCQLQFPNQSFDIVFSNSVIEHLGTLERQQAFARECRRVAGRLWVQTPARSFFLEVHLLTPFIHFLSKERQRKLIRNFTVWGLLARPTPSQVQDFLAEVRLLDRQEMQEMFPDCEIIVERFFGFIKSYIAVRGNAPS